MGLKHKIDKKTFDKLPPEMQENYNVDEDGKNYTLDVEGLDDAGELKRAKDRETEAAKKLRKELKTAQDELAALQEASAGNDVEKIKATMQKKYDTDIQAANDKVTKLTNALKNKAVDAVADAMAARISTSPKLILPVIKGALQADIDDEGEVSIVVIEDGKPSKKAVADFEKELVASKDYAAIMIGTKASGGGGATRKDPPSNGSGAASDRNNSERPADPSKMKPNQLTEWLKERKDARQP
jgi:hypothetical protein